MVNGYWIRHRRALIVLTLVGVAVPAAAQEAPSAATQRPSSADAPQPVRLAIDGLTPGSQVRVVPKYEHAPKGADAGICTQDCELELPKGAYTLIASRGDEQRTEDVELVSSQVLKVDEWTSLRRTTGLVLGITGIVVGAIGTLLIVGVATAPPYPPESDEASPGRAGIAGMGFIGVLAGGGLSIAGFSLAAARAPSMNLERMPISRPVPTAAGGGISLSGRF